jgi:hypothetical protein
VEKIRQLLKSWRCIQISMSLADEQLAVGLFARSVPLDQIDRGILPACARKYVALCNSDSDGAITSFGYSWFLVALRQPRFSWRDGGCPNDL